MIAEYPLRSIARVKVGGGDSVVKMGDFPLRYIVETLLHPWINVLQSVNTRATIEYYDHPPTALVTRFSSLFLPL